MDDSEEYIVNLILDNLYLIDEECYSASGIKKEVFIKSGGRADIVLTLKNIVYIIEVKRGVLTTNVADQLIRYINTFNVGISKEIIGILVGKKPPDCNELIAYLKASGHCIKPLYIDHHIPLEYNICNYIGCRRINRTNALKCRWCGEPLMKIW
ncbi:MAG: hypothetical protein HQL61_02915 [Magnetococcales bacterium]|nr:hypothetical protein [Nitrospirota bacterium]